MSSASHPCHTSGLWRRLFPLPETPFLHSGKSQLSKPMGDTALSPPLVAPKAGPSLDPARLQVSGWLYDSQTGGFLGPESG